MRGFERRLERIEAGMETRAPLPAEEIEALDLARAIFNLLFMADREGPDFEHFDEAKTVAAILRQHGNPR